MKRAAATKNADPDRRLVAGLNREAAGGDGGYLVPPDVRSEVTSIILGEQSFLGRTFRQTATSNSVTLPVDAAAAWQTTGAEVKRVPEGAQAVPAAVKWESRVVRLDKLEVLLPVTNELFEDSAGLDAYLRRAIPERMDFKITDWLINGNGVGKPLGLLESGAKITQTKEGSQTADTINYANVRKMWSRLYGPGRRSAVWLAHSDAESELQGMTTPGGTQALIYPPDSPHGYLFGRPVLVSEACAPLGDEGDLILVDPSSIFTVTREGGVREDVSFHVWFDYDRTAFRFTLRLGGLPFWRQPLTRYKGGNTVSTIVTLENR